MLTYDMILAWSDKEGKYIGPLINLDKSDSQW